MPWDGEERRKNQIVMKEQLDSIAFGLQKVSIQLDNYHSNSKSFKEGVEEEIAKIKLTLYGNGQPGITSKINAISDIRNEIKEHSLWDRWLFALLIGLNLTIFGWLVIHAG